MTCGCRTFRRRGNPSGVIRSYQNYTNAWRVRDREEVAAAPGTRIVYASQSFRCWKRFVVDRIALLIRLIC
ncbi:unnamed protein product [Amoebophrya sp. A25]|nr:unnamed protein product [Amoebophrya sp. A25]|eukprot:GSA25T00017738001.1